MRELLFRGFHPCDGPDTIVVNGERVTGRWVEGYLWSKRTIGVTSPCGNTDEVVVLPSTVGQWTGLTDRNEKRIWEGDKLFSSHRQETFRVEWDKTLCCFRLSIVVYYDDMAMANCYEVIGTVFDEEGSL